MGPVNDFHIDVALIREEVQKMMLPHQKVSRPLDEGPFLEALMAGVACLFVCLQLLLVTAVHGLHEHRHVSTAVFKALKGDTVHSAGPNG